MSHAAGPHYNSWPGIFTGASFRRGGGDKLYKSIPKHGNRELGKCAQCKGITKELMQSM